jgi:hypothetical protein
MREQVASDVLQSTSAKCRARAAYLAICLDLAPDLRKKHPDAWKAAIEALAAHSKFVAYLYSDRPGTPAHKRLREKATAAGLRPD